MGAGGAAGFGVGGALVDETEAFTPLPGAPLGALHDHGVISPGADTTSHALFSLRPHGLQVTTLLQASRTSTACISTNTGSLFVCLFCFIASQPHATAEIRYTHTHAYLFVDSVASQHTLTAPY